MIDHEYTAGLEAPAAASRAAQAGGRPLPAPGNPATPRADASRPAAHRPAGAHTSAAYGPMARAAALATVRRMMRRAFQAAALAQGDRCAAGGRRLTGA